MGGWMTSEAITWGALITAAISFIAIVTFWMNLGSRLTTAEIKAAAAEAQSAAAIAKYEMVIRDYADHRVALEVKIAIVKTLAEANTTALTAADIRMAKGLEGVIDRLDGFNTRVDRMLEQRDGAR